jgi:hypothetical protein
MTTQTDDRVPVAWANYSPAALPAIQADIAAGRAMGPSYMGEVVWPITAHHDPDTGMTRVGFSYQGPPA